MKICIDGIGAGQLMGMGMGSFTKEFLNKLLEMYPQPSYDLLFDNPKFPYILEKNRNATLFNLKVNRKMNDYSILEEHIERNKVNIYHSLNNGFSIPANKKCNYITTVQEMLPLYNPNYVDAKYMRKFTMTFSNAIKNSDRIIVLSEFLKEQLNKNYSIPEKKLTVINPGCSEIFTPQNKESSENILTKKYKIQDEYILHVGAIHIRKNIEKLICAFKQINVVNPTIKLVFVGKYDGKRKNYYMKLRQLIQRLGISDSVIFTGTVDYYDMPFFYSKAKCLVNLSKYEGYPLSCLEAMSCDAPVIWNNTDCFKEILGDSGVKVDIDNDYYYNIDELVNAISKIVFENRFSEELLKRQRMQVSKYKWENNIISTIRLYEDFY
jgi:glycosyltransferase involved in cell wall biosynthesis